MGGIFILSNVSPYVRRAHPKDKVINRARKINKGYEVGNKVGKAQEVLLTSFVNETNGTVLADVPKQISHPPWDLLNKCNVEHLRRLIMKPNPLPKDLRDFQNRLWIKMKIKKARQRFQNEIRKTFSVPEYLHLCRGCGVAIIPGFVLHLFSRHGVCKYSYYSGVRIRPCVRRPRVARTGAFTFADLKDYFCSFEFSLVGEMIKKIGLVWKRGSGSAGHTYMYRRSSKKPSRARTSAGIRGRGQRSAARRARACTSSSVLVLVVLALSCVIGGVQAAFTPADSAALQAAVGTCTVNHNTYPYTYPCTGGCLGENATGSCPIFSASNDATGNPYGVMGDWDVSRVSSMKYSTSNVQLFVFLFNCLFHELVDF